MKMIAFNFGPFSKDELTITLDEEGAALLLSRISELANGAENAGVVDCLRYFRRDFDKARIEFQSEMSDRLEIRRCGLLLGLSRDALEYAVHQLSEFLAKGYFFPAEFWSFSRLSRKYDTQIFFAKFSSMEDMISSCTK
ncbi:hypothetical protein ACSFBF_30950 [Variovorax sp. ZT5P49]|uniref:hypothetical protein n=1 Tax=Variovorax sp. ZT5P49 TaxID=3443733 RepID=UPI003F47C656